MADDLAGMHPDFQRVFISEIFIRQQLEDLIDRHGLADGFGGYVFLCKALKTHSLRLAKFFLMEGASVICENSGEKVPPLILAAQCPSHENAQDVPRLFVEGEDVPRLLLQNLNLDEEDINEEPPIELTEIVEMLLDRGASVSDVDMFGRSALHYAASLGRETILILLLREGAKIEKPDNQQMTPLHMAASKNHAGAVELLTMKGADPNATNYWGETSLHLATSEGHLEASRMLLTKGANPNITNLNGETPLHFVGVNADADSTVEEIVTLLLNHKADMYVKTKCGRTPLHINIRKEGIVKILLEHGVDANTKSKDGRTPLHFAAEYGSDEVIQLLLNNNADVKAVDPDGKTPLHFAAENGCLSTVKLLLEKEAKVDAVDSNDNTPLHLAAKYSFQADFQGGVIEVLLENGANVNAINKQGDAPINRALSRRAINALSMHKAKINWQGNLKQTALHHAILCNNADAVKSILHCGVDSSLEDCSGKTPLTLALSRRVDYNSITMILKKHTIRLKVAGWYVSEKDLSLLSQHFCDALKRFEESCMDEVSRMKNKSLDSDFTLFNILSEYRNPSYLQNKKIMKKLADFDLDPFPIYRSLIMNCLEENSNHDIN